MGKLKEKYEAADVELILFEFSDIVTTSVTFDDEDNWGDWT